MLDTVDELLQGAIELHFHAYPEFSLARGGRFSLEQHLRMMAEAGMDGVVLKSHFWPTVGAAEWLKNAVPDFHVFGSITLNASSGGLELWAVEAALLQNARIVWLPTWSARNDLKRQGVCRLVGSEVTRIRGFTEQQGITLFDEKGRLLPVVHELLALCRDAGVCLCTGHISPEESLALARAAREAQFTRLVFNHPDSHSIGATMEHIREMARLGAFIEICALGLTPPYRRITPPELAGIIRTVGAERCFLSTDYFFEWAAPVPEQLRMLLCLLIMEGLGEEEARTMVCQVPRFLLQLD